MKISLCILIGLTASAAIATPDKPTNTDDDQKPWLVRVRALDMNPAIQSRAFTALNTNFRSDAISLNSKIFPEVDFSYFFTKNIAAELVLTYPQQHNVTLAGVGNIGTVSHLPPTLTLQYHYPIQNTPFTPYIGAGINYTLITQENLSVGGVGLGVTRSSVGFAYGAGLDYKLDKSWSINLDYKHVDITTNVKVKSSGAILTNLDVNPNLFSIGIGYRF